MCSMVIERYYLKKEDIDREDSNLNLEDEVTTVTTEGAMKHLF